MLNFNKTIKSGNALLAILCLAYFSIAAASSPLSTSQIWNYIKFYFSIYTPYLIAFIFVFWAAKSIIFLFENREKGFIGLSECWIGLRNDYISRQSILRFLMIFPLIPFINFSYSSLKQEIAIAHGTTIDLYLQKADFILHGGHNPWDVVQPLFTHRFSTLFIDFLYLFWGALFLFTLLWMAISKRQLLRFQFFFSLISCWLIIGNLFAKLLASAGPCYFSKVVSGVPDPYASMMVHLRSTPGLKAVMIQDALWQAHLDGVFMPLGGISAMPSMHVSIAVLLALVYFNVNRYLGILFIVYAAVIQIGSVYLGWHYAIDGYLSILLTVSIWKVVGGVISLRNRRTVNIFSNALN